jgi:alkylated DNA repair protein alkB family protein 8
VRDKALDLKADDWDSSCDDLKPYALLEYESPDHATVAFGAVSKAVLAYAAPTVVDRIMSSIQPSHPAPRVSSLDPTVHEFSNGLLLIHEFISKEEEEGMIQEYQIATSSREGRAPKRGSVHYGPHFDYTTFAVSKTASTPPPEYLTRLLDRLPARDDRDIPDQYTIQYYPPGTGIPPHVDTHSAFEETIYSLSFGASTRMDFKLCGEKESRRLHLPKRSLGGIDTPPQQQQQSPSSPSIQALVEEEEDTEEWELELPPRSLLVMRGPSRYGYTHGIKGRKYDQEGTEIVARQDRYSLTMRKIKPAEKIGCDCVYSHVCSWWLKTTYQLMKMIVMMDDNDDQDDDNDRSMIATKEDPFCATQAVRQRAATLTRQ